MVRNSEDSTVDPETILRRIVKRKIIESIFELVIFDKIPSAGNL